MATPKKPTPKAKPRVVISGSVSSSGGGATGTKSVTRGASMVQSPKIVEKKPSVLRAKVKKAVTKARDAQEYSTRTSKVIKTQPASAENKRLRDVGNRRALDAGRTATRGKIQLMNSMKPKKK
jgi:hypothetical protein